MNKTTHTAISLHHLKKLAAFAQFLLQERLEEYIQKQIQYSFEAEIPLLQYFLNIPEAERYQLTKKAAKEFLGYLSQDKAAAQIEKSLQQWRTNQLPVVDRDAIVAEDITLINYIRKKAMLEFVADYTKDPYQIIELVKELDFFTVQSITAATNLYIDLLKERIEEHSHFIQKVNENIPGAVYVFDTQQYKGIYSNNKLNEIIGYDHADLNALGEAAIPSLIHPADQNFIKQQQEALRLAKDGEVLATKYRIKKKDGSYRWLANYESVFKRREDGTTWQTIGITLDIDQEQKVVEELHKREVQLLEAQDIAQMGTYYWDFQNDASTASSKTQELLEMAPGDFENFMQKVHPGDRDNIKRETETALATGTYNCEYRIQGAKGDKMIWARGVVDYNNGQPVGMTGTVMDITAHHHLVQQLARSESLYKGAEKIANMGNWSWNVAENNLEWTDQLYHIYGLEPQSEKITMERFLSFVHPADRAFVQTGIDKLTTETSLDYTFRIITGQGTEKWLRSIAQVRRNDKGRIDFVIGTEQDVTEKQRLIGRLEESRRLYKQAQELAKMGNFSWDLQTDAVYWSDEVYAIYEHGPGEPITFNDAFTPILEAHKEKVQNAIAATLSGKKGQSVSYAIHKREGGLKYITLNTDVLLSPDGQVSHIIGTAQDITEKEELIERLQESEKLYKQAQSLTRMGNWTWDLLTQTTTWSDELFDIYELPKGSPLTQEEWYNYLDPLEKEALHAAFRECITGHTSMDITHKLLLPNGKIKTLHRKGELIYNEAGQAIKMVGTTQDVTEQYQTQADLRDSQNFIRKITDATPSVIASYNVNTGRYTFISEGLQKLLGYDTREVMENGVAFFESIIHPDDLPAVLEKNRKAFEDAGANNTNNDIVVEYTYRLKHKNGSYRWFHTYGTIFDRNKENRVEHILNISLDVTEQKEAIATIREQEYFIQQIADASPTILYLFDVPAQSIAYINRETYFVLGYLPEEIVEKGDAITDLLYHPDDLPLLPQRQGGKKVFQQVDSMIQYECRMRHKDGGYRWLLVREIVFKTADDGTVKQIIGAALDINRRKEMEKTILQNSLQLQQSNASLEEFAYVASHDLKEPLRKISTFGDRLVTSQTDRMNEEGKLYLHKIVDASQRMQNMISDLLSISLISGNKAFENYSLQKILEETVQTLDYKIEQLNAVITHDRLPVISIVPSQFRQLFQNLIANSLKFVREDVQPLINIAAKFVGAGELEGVQLVKAGRYLRLQFSDNGIGFENEYAQKIFAIFQRLHGRSEYEGSGIGLAICKKIVEHHGGVIFAQGTPGSGATFIIILPA